MSSNNPSLREAFNSIPKAESSPAQPSHLSRQIPKDAEQEQSSESRDNAADAAGGSIVMETRPSKEVSFGAPSDQYLIE